MSNSAPRVPATATFNRKSGAMWLTYADGRVAHLNRDGVRSPHAAATVLGGLGAVRLSDWMLVADRAPMSQARIEVRPDVADTW